MEIEWALVLFTAITGCGGWVSACIAINVLLGKAQRTDFVAGIVGIVLLGVGGCASVFHLQHPGRILNALNHPTSGIFVEAVLVGLGALALFVFIVALKREAPAIALKIIAAIAGFLGVLLAYMAGHSYMMEAIPAWNTQFLPIGYLLTAAPGGIAVYLLVALLRKEEESTTAFFTKLLVGGGIAALVGACAYALVSSQSGTALVVIVCSALACGVVPTVCGFVALRKPRAAKALAIVAIVFAMAGIILYRCDMWLSGVAAMNFFGNL